MSAPHPEGPWQPGQPLMAPPLNEASRASSHNSSTSSEYSAGEGQQGRHQDHITSTHSTDDASSDETRAPSPTNEDAKGSAEKKGSSKGEQKEDGQTETETTLDAYKRQLKREQDLVASRGLDPTVSELAVAWNHLSVRGLGGAGDVLYAPTIGKILSGPFGTIADKKRAKKLGRAKTEHDRDEGMANEKPEHQEEQGGKGKGGKKGTGLGKGEKYLIHDFAGVVKPGEMMLVVGRPGSGCTTFLKSVTGLTEGFAGVDGEVQYGDIKSQKELRPIKGQVIFNSEDDIHFPNLQVGRTLDFALRNNTPNPSALPLKNDEATVPTLKEYEDSSKETLLRILGLPHTHDTKVGDAYVRGVSGGERKRVSIAEVLTNRASVQAWDNATRGLDANTALEYTKIMRILSDVKRNATLVSLYQAGNAIYDLFDKVLVIAEGETLYYGPRKEAQKYMEDLGFECQDGANVADFLTGVTVSKERKVREGYEGKIPGSIADFAKAYRESDIAKRMQKELEEHLADEEHLRKATEGVRAIVQREKHKGAIKTAPQTTPYALQVRAALIREAQQRWEDKYTFWARQGTTLIQAFIIGSLFYSVPLTTGGLFTRGGAIFLTLLFPSLLSLAETTAAFEGRAIMAKHKAFSMYRPSAVILAQTIADLPVLFVQLTVFVLIVYFMTGLKTQPGAFFEFLLFVYMNTLCTMGIFRAIGSAFSTFQGASKVSGFMFSVLVTYAGYIIPTPSMKPWFGWIRWINPFYYSFEALMSQEFAAQTFECIPTQLAPYGPGYTPGGQNQGCAIAGATFGSTALDGPTYLDVALRLYQSHTWRNFGIIIALWIAFVALTMFLTERLPAAGSTKSYLYYKRGGGGKFIKSAANNGDQPRDEEEGSAPTQHVGESGNSEKQQKKDDATSDVDSANTIFTWKDLTYIVPNGGKPLTLLDNVSGYCKPGTLTALMGSSGAGKTTLLDVLAQRKSDGEITGEVLVNGQALSVSFQRTTGYCEQLDVHLPQATVREALEFSALLRQPRSIPDKEKIAYVDVIIDLLELHDIEDALVGVPGAGLGIEQRKRLTIGVELVSKPTLLFLDEPTSGLDGQSSFLILSFMRKLAAAGQSVLCTIHQPSASLFAEFDSLLLLKRGGKTVYFGKIDELGDYFEKEDVKIPKNVNPAEFMIDVVSGDLSKGRDWAEVWLNSENCKKLGEEIEELKEKNKDAPAAREDDKYEFAATTMTQLRLVTKRASFQLWRDTEYVMSKVWLHVGSGLFNGFSFWMIGTAYADLQNRLFTIFQFIFVAPGVIAQVQPKFIANRDIYETREKKAKLYTWAAFVFGEIVAEVPYLLVCAFLYFAVWYATVGFSFKANVAGPVYLQMTLYEFLYTGIGQFVAAYAPNAVFAALVNPLLIGVLVSFSGVLVPYSQITSFWRYWLYYLNPFNYLMGGLLVFPLWDQVVECTEKEYGRFAPPSGQTCGEYMAPFLSRTPGYLQDPSSTTECAYCIYSKGSEYLQSLNLKQHYYGWRDIGITALFCLSSYGFVFLLMKLRTKKTKAAAKKNK